MFIVEGHRFVGDSDFGVMGVFSSVEAFAENLSDEREKLDIYAEVVFRFTKVELDKFCSSDNTRYFYFGENKIQEMKIDVYRGIFVEV